MSAKQGEEGTQHQKERPGFTTHPNFRRFLQFGVVDSSLLMLSILAGFSLDSLIARRIGAKGYGAIMGAGIGNALADTVAGLPEGRHAAVGVGLGALVPLTPIITAMLLRKELTGRVAYAVGASSATLFVGTFVHSYLQPDEEETD